MRTTLPVLVVIAALGCRQPANDKKTQMMLDSAASGENVTVVRSKQALQPDEAITDLRRLSTIMQHDLDAQQRTPSKDVIYVKPGEPVRPSEARR